MNNFYPKGAIKGKKKVEELLDKRCGGHSNLYLVSQIYNTYTVYRIKLDQNTKIVNSLPAEWSVKNLDQNTKIVNSLPAEWSVKNSERASTFYLQLNLSSGYLESCVTKGYIFSNFWHAWAYANHLEQSGFTIDWCFPVGVG